MSLRLHHRPMHLFELILSCIIRAKTQTVWHDTKKGT